MKDNWIYLIIVVILCSCKNIPKDKLPDICSTSGFTQPVEKVSLKDTTRIKQLNGKFIEVEGVFYSGFEESGLYPFKGANCNEALWLDLIIPSSVPENVKFEYNKRELVVIGRVNTECKGHSNCYIATLDSAFCIKPK